MKADIIFCESPWVQCVAEIENCRLWFNFKEFHFIKVEHGVLEWLKSTPLFCNSVGTWSFFFYEDEWVVLIPKTDLTRINSYKLNSLPCQTTQSTSKSSKKKNTKITGIIICLGTVVLAAKSYWTCKLYTWGKKMRFLPSFLLPKSIYQGKQGVTVCLMTNFHTGWIKSIVVLSCHQRVNVLECRKVSYFQGLVTLKQRKKL